MTRINRAGGFATRIENNCPENRRANNVYMGDKCARIPRFHAKELFGRANRNGDLNHG